MTITSTRKGGKIVLSLRGRIDIYSADEFEIFTANILPDIEEETVMVLDCRDLIYISSAGLRVVLSAYKALKRKNGRLEVINASPAIIEIFTITGFIKILKVTPPGHCMPDTQSDFSSDCPNLPQEYCRISR